jgi:hypothetical protein
MMATFTLSVVGYLNTLSNQSGLTINQVKTALEEHGELTPGRIRQALKWAENASSGESWQTDTDLHVSDQADIYLTKS